jgi:hypothetical protein
MRKLSVSAAWDETKVILARDGRLLVTVALALIALPATLATLLNPNGTYNASTPLWLDGVALIVYLVALAGQLSLIRLATGPSVTVGGAIVHGIRRVPIYLAGLLLIVFVLIAFIVLIGLALGAMGVRVTTQVTTQMSPGAMAAALVFLAAFAFLFVRFVLSAPVASAEPVGPIGILKRSWDLTAGHWWHLFGFLLVFFIGSALLVLAVGSAAGVVIQLLIGSVQPMSASALLLALIQALLSAAVSTLFAVMLARIYLQLAGPAAVEGGSGGSWG